MRRLLRTQLALLVWLILAALTARASKKNGEWKSAEVWEPAGKPEEGDDLTITGGFNVKAATGSIGRSLIGTSTGELSGSGEISIGTSTAPASNIAISFNSAFKVATTNAATMKLQTTVTAAAQTIDLGGKAWPAKIKFNTAGKWKLLSKLASSGGLNGQILVEAGTIEGNAQTIEGAALNINGSASIDLSGCTVVCTTGLTSEGWNWGSTGTLTTSSGTVFEIGGVEPSCQFGGGGKAYKGTVKWIGRTCRVDSLLGQTIEGALEILNKGTSAEGIKLRATATTILASGTSLVFNGTSGERCRIESSVAGEKHKLRLAASYEPTNSFVAVKDIKVEGGTLYLPNGTDLGGNEGIVFGSKKPPAGFIIGSSIESYATGEGFSAGEEFAWKFTALASAPLGILELLLNAVAPTATSLALGILSNNAGSPGTVLASGVVAKPTASQWNVATLNSIVNLVQGTEYWLALLPIGGGVGANLGVESGVDRKLAGAGYTEISTGSWEAEHVTNIGFRGIEVAGTPSGLIAQQLGFSQVASGRKIASGGIGVSLGLSTQASGLKVGIGSVAGSLRTVMAASGAKIAAGAVSERLGLSQALQGAKIARGAVSGALGLNQEAIGIKVGVGSLAQALGTSSVLAGKKIARGSVLQQVALQGAGSGHKQAVGAILQTFGVEGRWIVIANPGIATAFVFVKNHAVARVIVLDEAQATVQVIDKADAEVIHP